ncbi:DUF5995 family protein [Nocardioides sediminis]|uniref:DUF5995 family protein n=1 Tax=Nocardioides sediminis TaxID=433648 RepID=UPI000D31A30C|nr:DUF5995 family protein [Nocardioides sediminis]
MATARTVDEVIARMQEIDADLPAGDGVRVFNRMYLTVTERIAATLTDPGNPHGTSFRNGPAMAELDVRFANLWLEAYDADAAGRQVTRAWRPIFEARRGGRLPVQYAIAGMNTHIEHDLPVAVVDTCRALGLDPGDLHDDYEAVNDVLAQVESGVRRSFLDTLGREVDDRIGPVVHLLSTWNIDKARDLGWVSAETLWALRRTTILRDRFLDALGHTVGMTSRALLIPSTARLGRP